ncbi:MAG: D-alanyl-D-alanine carboxypeptidase [Aestuariivirga sp.]|uniref:D-alanyl-D-alanine carboxypeptidase n=1 Tax=Aestuariivirga sp. TaxID=2650926 RepID=UPI0025BEB64B|nr:D-alanyl-D-alanine carboxypeptidase [Aestuariivirga sp.]MCA3561004.1 D-alanyl-D-alanine carboxypeptidase [Aestuariivirga sp.]
MAAVLAVGLGISAAYAAPRFSALTVDARDGKVLYANDIDGIRHPASLTKMMTLYLLFQDLSAGKLKLNSPVTVSARCAGMAPSKLGVKAGQSITAETATRALIVKSANDIACAVAETLGGSESAFAQRMTRTARSLGMSRTTFRNASGLPNPNQVTSARDMATLGLRLMRDYPQYYPYFRTRSFVFQGKTITGHNRLLGSYEGADGIKTGYVAASGFNLVTSVRRGDRRLVGVVLGGRSGASRDAYMKQMLSQYFDDATSGRTIAAYAGSAKGAKPTEETETAAAGNAAAAPAAKQPRKDAAAKRLAARKSKAKEDRTAAAGAGEPAEQGDTEDGVDQMANLAAQAAQPATAAAAPAATGTTTQAAGETPQVETVPAPMPDQTVGEAPSTGPSEQKTQAQQLADQAQMAAIAAGTDGGWSISLGDYATKADATAVLQQMRKRTPGVLGGRTAQTVKVEKKGKITYRARFTGFDQASAAMACKTIKKKNAPCQPVGPS